MRKEAKQSPSQGEKDLNAKKHSVSMKGRTTIELDKDFVEYVKWHVDTFETHEGKTVQDLIVEAVQAQVNLERSICVGIKNMETLIFEDRLSEDSCVEPDAIPLSEFMDRIRENNTGEQGDSAGEKAPRATKEHGRVGDGPGLPSDICLECGGPAHPCLECDKPVHHGDEFCSMECDEAHSTKARPIVVRRAGFTATVVLNGIEKMTPHARRETGDHLHNALADFECNMASGHFFDLTPIPQGFMAEKND